MAKDILDELEKKSEDILRSNEELAEKLKRNQEAINGFFSQIEKMKSGDSYDPLLKKELEKIKSELENKKGIITALIDDLKPLEIDLTRREDVINALKARVDDQSRKIESLSKDLLNNSKQVQMLFDSNTALKKQAVEKDSMISVLKDKLNEKTSALKASEERASQAGLELTAAKKDVFAMQNRLGTIEKRVFTTDEQNQKLLYELMSQKERFKQLEAEIKETDSSKEILNAQYARSIEMIRKEEEEKKEIILKKYAQKMAVMNATISSLKSQLEQNKRLIEEKSRKEGALITDFNQRMRDLMKSDIDVGRALPVTESNADPMFDFRLDDDTKDTKSAFAAEIAGPEPIDKVEEIIPIVELAYEHGDEPDKIKHSLVSSGYSERDIEHAFSRLNLVVQK